MNLSIIGSSNQDDFAGTDGRRRRQGSRHRYLDLVRQMRQIDLYRRAAADFLQDCYFLEMMETGSMSLCRMDCSLRLSHLRVTPDQLVSVSVP